MYSLKGFIRIESLVKNTVGQNSPIGEPSTLALTYSRERGEYVSPSTPGLSLTSISSIDDTGKVPVPTNVLNHTLAVSKFVFDYAITKEGNINKADFTADVLTQFSGIMSTLNFGSFISNGNLSLPSFMSWTNITLPENIIKIWFSDNAFRQQYDQYEIVVIPPIAKIDDFFLPLSAIQSKIQAATFPMLQDLIQAAKLGNPETVTRSNSYDYYNPLTGQPGASVIWSALIYGLAGDNTDNINDAIAAYILANSIHTQSEWVTRFPDIFKRTEFIILPKWDNYAIPNLSVSSGIYSPIFNLKESFAYTKTKVPNYRPVHIDNFLSAFGLTYKSLVALCISNPDNRSSMFSLTDLFPDYIDESTLSTDFNRQSLNTQEFSSLLEHLVIVAETANDYNDIPPDVRRVKRGPTTFISAVYKNVQYLVATRSSNGLPPIVNPPTPRPTRTPINTVTPTPTRSPIITPVPTGTPTRTPTITPTVTPTRAVTTTPSPTINTTATPTSTPTPTVTGTPTPVPSGILAPVLFNLEVTLPIGVTPSVMTTPAPTASTGTVFSDGGGDLGMFSVGQTISVSPLMVGVGSTGSVDYNVSVSYSLASQTYISDQTGNLILGPGAGIRIPVTATATAVGNGFITFSVPNIGLGRSSITYTFMVM